MFIITAKFPWRKLTAAAAAAAVLFVCFLTLSPDPAANCTAPVSAPVSGTRVRTNEERVEFLTSLGWQVESDPIAVQELMIPDEMGEAYAEYLELQTGQGFDLAACAGKRVRRYSYRILNYPTGEQDVQANLLVRRGRLVGGEVLSPKPNGLLHGLERSGAAE